MDLELLAQINQTLWIWVAAPLTLVAALVLSLKLRLPQLLAIPEAIRGIRKSDQFAEGSVHPATAVVLSTVAAHGAAGAIGTATALSLGGPGALGWLWLFAFLLAPLRMAEVLLARTTPPGQPSAARGSLTTRLLNSPQAAVQGLGWAMLIMIPVSATLFYGGVHGAAVLEAGERLMPDAGLPIALGVAALGAILAVLPARRVGSLMGWIAVACLFSLFGAALFTVASEPSRAMMALGRALTEALHGAPSAASFSGALSAEIAFAAMLYILPPMGASLSIVGPTHDKAMASTTRAQASAALLGPLFYAVVVTTLGISMVATGAVGRRVEGERNLSELRFYGVGFETVSQRQEIDRRYHNINPIRIIDGSLGVVPVELATERGMVEEPHFFDRGEPANAALHVTDGRADEIQTPGEMGALRLRPPSELDNLSVRGQMLPRGATLMGAALTRGGGGGLEKLSMVALLLLAALGAGVWGLGVIGAVRARMSARFARFFGVLPAFGIVLAATGIFPGFGLLGGIVAALLATVSALALMIHARQAGQLSK